MDDTDFFSTETISVPINFRLFAIAHCLYRKQSEKYSAKWDWGFSDAIAPHIRRCQR